MQIAFENTSGWRQIRLSALKAPIDGPVTTISMSLELQSLRIAGTSS